MIPTATSTLLDAAFVELEALGRAYDTYRLFRLARVGLLETGEELSRLGVRREAAGECVRRVEDLIARRQRTRGWPPGVLARRIGNRIGPLGRCEDLDGILEDADPGGRVVGEGSDRLPLLLALAGGYVLREEWVEHHSLVGRRSPGLVARLVRMGPVDLAELRRALDAHGVRAELQLPWIEGLPGHQLIDGRLFPRAEFSDVDRAAIELHRRGSPQSLRDLFARARGPLSTRDGFESLLTSDRRFVRSDWTRYGLAEWGGEPFRGTQEAMCLEIERHGGDMAIVDLAAILNSRYGVPVNAVLEHAHLLRRVDDRGRIAWEPCPPLRPSRQPLADVPGCFRLPSGWALRLGVTASLLRGAALPVPAPFADLLDPWAAPATTIDCRPGPLTVNWRRAGPLDPPRLRGLHAAALPWRAEPDDLLFLVLRPLGGLELQLVRRCDLDRLDGICRLAAECGRRVGGDHLSEVATALGLAPDLPDPRSAIVGRLRLRGEDRMLRLVAADERRVSPA